MNSKHVQARRRKCVIQECHKHHTVLELPNKHIMKVHRILKKLHNSTPPQNTIRTIPFLTREITEIQTTNKPHTEKLAV